MKRTINESQIRKIVAESVKKVLNEIGASEEHNIIPYSNHFVVAKELYLDEPSQFDPYSNDLWWCDKDEAYNNENLLDNPKIKKCFEWATDRFAGVTRNGDMFLNSKPSIPVCNLKKDKIFGTMVGDNPDCIIGEEGILIKRMDGTCVLVNSDEDVFTGNVIKRGDRYIFVKK